MTLNLDINHANVEVEVIFRDKSTTLIDHLFSQTNPDFALAAINFSIRNCTVDAIIGFKGHGC